MIMIEFEKVDYGEAMTDNILEMIDSPIQIFYDKRLEILEINRQSEVLFLKLSEFKEIVDRLRTVSSLFDAKLRKLTQQEVLALQPNDITLYHIKCWRLREDGPELTWQGESKIHVQRAAAFRKFPERLSCITVKAIDWAEGSYKDIMDDGNLVVENYMMEIFVRE
jgi:hypothetical protein